MKVDKARAIETAGSRSRADHASAMADALPDPEKGRGQARLAIQV